MPVEEEGVEGRGLVRRLRLQGLLRILAVVVGTVVAVVLVVVFGRGLAQCVAPLLLNGDAGPTKASLRKRKEKYEKNNLENL